MLVLVVELRVTGMKLTSEELAEANRHRGNLTLQAGTLYLHRGGAPALDQVLHPLSELRCVSIKGDDMMWAGTQFIVHPGGVRTHHPQAWWCKRIDGPPEPGSPLFQRG